MKTTQKQRDEERWDYRKDEFITGLIDDADECQELEAKYDELLNAAEKLRKYIAHERGWE